MVQYVDSKKTSGNRNTVWFVAGALRSGSTLLRLMLNAHPKVSNPGEFDFLFDYIESDGTLPEPEAYRRWLSTNRIFQATNLQLDTSLGYIKQVRNFVAQASADGVLTIFNIHRNFDKVPLVFPNAKFVHLLRDPRDVARSSIGMGWAGHVYYGVDHWINTERSWSKLERDIGPACQIQVHYEHLVREPRETLERVFNFLGVAFEESALSYTRNSSYTAPDPRLADQWKRKQTQSELRLLEGKLGDTLTDKGYEPSGSGSRKPLLPERIYLILLNKGSRFKFAVNRYGFSLVMQELIARRLGLEAWWRTSTIKMNAITRKYLR